MPQPQNKGEKVCSCGKKVAHPFSDVVCANFPNCVPMPTPNVPSKGKRFKFLDFAVAPDSKEGAVIYDNLSKKYTFIPREMFPVWFIKNKDKFDNPEVVPPHSQGECKHDFQTSILSGITSCKKCHLYEPSEEDTAEPPIKEVWEDDMYFGHLEDLLYYAKLEYAAKDKKGHMDDQRARIQKLFEFVKGLLSSHSHEIAERVRGMKVKIRKDFDPYEPNDVADERCNELCEDIARSIEESNK